MAGESNDIKILATQQQTNFELQITQLQIEKQNLANIINLMQNQHEILFRFIFVHQIHYIKY
jgi:hypothetical protein